MPYHTRYKLDDPNLAKINKKRFDFEVLELMTKRIYMQNFYYFFAIIITFFIILFNILEPYERYDKIIEVLLIIYVWLLAFVKGGKK